MKYKKVSEILEGKDVSLEVTENESNKYYDILKFQPMAKLYYSKDRGIFCDEERYLEKVNNFIGLAIKKQPGLLITPEGSIPKSSLENIVNDKEKWPDIGKLWCLCMSGMSKKEFKELINELDNKTNIEIIIEYIENYKTYVNSLFYLFRIDKDKLAIVIQLKTAPMSDRQFESEAVDLTRGNAIYIFDLNKGNDTNNVLLSLICADAIQVSMSDLVNELKGKYPIIINSQCNYKPFHDEFKRIRISFFSDRNVHEFRWIVTNWAKKTEINSDEKMNETGNVYYNYLYVDGNNHLGRKFSNKDAFYDRMKNQINGVSYFADYNFNIWSFPDEENISWFIVKKEECHTYNNALNSNFDPVVKEIYFYKKESNDWVKFNKYCELLGDKKLSNLYISKNELLRPYNYSICLNEECGDKCLWLYNDYFFGICFGEDMRSELECNYEVSKRTIFALNEEGRKKTFHKRKLFEILVKLIETNKIPKELSLFSKNIKFDIDTNAAETGSNNIYNVSVENVEEEHPNWHLKKGIFAILDTEQINIVEKTYKTLYDSTNKENRDQILLYYRLDGNYTPYDTPHKERKITHSNSTFTKNTTSILKGGNQYEEN
ncbi:MAG TPA: hypothetical protein VJ962_01625 [Clostridia bacterium]|nr:hypothetical protein [Clostridia bacterium]